MLRVKNQSILVLIICVSLLIPALPCSASASKPTATTSSASAGETQPRLMGASIPTEEPRLPVTDSNGVQPAAYLRAKNMWAMIITKVRLILIFPV